MRSQINLALPLVLATIGSLFGELNLVHASESALAQDEQVEDSNEKPQPRSHTLHKPPTELFEVTRVVDGDTIHVLRAGETEKLRLLSVDTEEVVRGGGSSNGTKPQTVFGTECAAWAQSYFDALADEEGTTRVGLWFPGEIETRDIYGRLLCHVVLEDGTDFNLLLLEKGKSPYFNKYGNSTAFDAEFRAAQSSARSEGIGIWNLDTNTAKTAGAPSIKRPYERLMPWWEARAEAIQHSRKSHAKAPLKFVDAGEADQLEAATRAFTPEPARVEVFGTVDRIFDEDDGSQTVLFRASDRGRALRVKISEEAIAAHSKLDLATLNEEFRQNYVWVTGAMSWTGRGYEIISSGPESWRIAPDSSSWQERLFKAIGPRSLWAAALGIEYELSLFRAGEEEAYNQSHVWVSFADASSHTETQVAGEEMTVVIGAEAGWARTPSTFTAYPPDLCERVRERVRVNLYRNLHLLASGALQGVHVDENGDLRGVLPRGQSFSLALNESDHPSDFKISPDSENEQLISYTAWQKSGLISFATKALRAGDPPSKQEYGGLILLKELDSALFE
ncbi:MAG: thermonuclease family protein [Planctomycetota bacterium]|nr:thermonuclease family protein [Planctomycetota bacterium]